MSTMFFIQFAVVLLCILIGAQVGGIGLGVLGGIGLAVLSFGFHLQPTSPPIDVMLMIMAVVSAAAAMQASGGLDYMINDCHARVAPQSEIHHLYCAGGNLHLYRLGRYGPCGLLGLARDCRSQPSQWHPSFPSVDNGGYRFPFAIVASPIAAAVVACVSMLEPQHITMADVLKVTVPSTILGIGLACVFVNKLGKELKDDPHYQALLKDPNYVKEYIDVEEQQTDVAISPKAKLSVGIFLTAALLVVVMGALPELRPAFEHDGAIKPMGMAHTIEIVMLSASALIILACKPNGDAITRGSVFHAGMRAVIAVFGVAWLGDTLMNGHLTEVESTVSHLVESAPWTFAFALFVLSVLVNSQGATVATLFPIAIKLGIPAPIIIGTFVAVNGYFFIPNYGPIIAAIDFDTTGSTKIGKFIFNHSFMIPGLLSMAFSLALVCCWFNCIIDRLKNEGRLKLNFRRPF